MSRHPVLDALEREKTVSPADLEFLIRHGRPYVGQRLPAGIRRRPAGTCLDTADDLEAEGRGRFVRGFGLLAGSRKPLMHAWASPDDRTAIDAVWPEPDQCLYWGLDRGQEARLMGMTRKRSLVSIPSLGFRF